jgi:hypothetical protein
LEAIPYADLDMSSAAQNPPLKESLTDLAERWAALLAEVGAISSGKLQGPTTPAEYFRGNLWPSKVVPAS